MSRRFQHGQRDGLGALGGTSLSSSGRHDSGGEFEEYFQQQDT